MTMKYPADLIRDETINVNGGIAGISGQEIILGNTTVSQDIKTWESVTINSNVTIQSGIDIIAQKGVRILPGSIITPNVRITTDLFTACTGEVSPLPDAVVTNFCESSKYDNPNRAVFRTANENHENSSNQSVDNGLSIYPNPATESFKVATNQEGKVRVEVYDMMGNLLFSKEIIEGVLLNVATDSFGAGIYLLKSTSAKSAITKRIIIN